MEKSEGIIVVSCVGGLHGRNAFGECPLVFVGLPEHPGLGHRHGSARLRCLSGLAANS